MDDHVRMDIDTDLLIMHHKGVDGIVIIGLQLKNEIRVLFAVTQLHQSTAVLEASRPIDEETARQLLSGKTTPENLEHEEISASIPGIAYLRRPMTPSP